MSIDPNHYGEVARIIRTMFGLGLLQARKAIEIAEQFCDGDVVAGAGYIEASGLAVNVRHDRHGWNLRHGRDIAERMRERPENRAALDELEALLSQGLRP